MRRRLTTEEWIQRARLVHGDKYDYSLVDYIHSETKVTIKCHEHGFFSQVPSNHAHKTTPRGCPQCGLNRDNTKQFIEKSRSVHGYKYNYDKVVYVKNRLKVTIHCPEHGYFEQTPNNHLKGSKCPKCVGRNKTTEEVVKIFKEVHGDKYNYDKVVYIRSCSKVIIHCYEHGDFKQCFDKHYGDKQGCPKCGREEACKKQSENPNGWSVTQWERKSKESKYFDSFKVYIIKCWSENESFYKIGRTFRHVNKRFGCYKFMPYSYEILHEFIFDNGKDCFDKENELKRLHKDYKYIPKIKFSGMQEFFYKITI